jgi:Nif-specific regulatory protein
MQEGELESLKRERELLLQLLALGSNDDVEQFLHKALSLLIEVVGARRGYIELLEPGEGKNANSFFLLRGLDEGALSPDAFSRSVINETFATGQTVVTASASSDPRFRESGSVRARRLEAVLCAPMGSTPVLGVIYLQDRVQPGPFSELDRERAELFARHVGSIADRLLARRKRTVEADATLAVRARLTLAGVVGSSEALGNVLQQLALVAPLNIGVLLTGESGTGKTQLARALHDNSPRAAFPFVELNCAALPEELLENELFGAAPGAHSTAQRRMPGKIEAAEGGTLFLDEVGELPQKAQAKLLQVLQSGTYYALGANTPRSANVRMVAATNANLASAVAERRFREDLYYRLSVFPIRVPALAERRGDIPALAAHFCKAVCDANRLPALSLSSGALAALEHADWPGNVRELAHLVQAGVVRAHGAGLLQVERQHLFPNAPRSSDPPSGAQLSFHEATRRFQARLLRDTLEQTDWNVAAAARALDMTRAHVYNLLATFQITRPIPRGGRTDGP